VQILDLEKINTPDSVTLIGFTNNHTKLDCHLSQQEILLAIYGLLGITQPYLNRCGEILPTNQQMAGILSVAVVVKHLLPNARPHLLFHEATSLTDR